MRLALSFECASSKLIPWPEVLEKQNKRGYNVRISFGDESDFFNDSNLCVCAAHLETFGNSRGITYKNPFALHKGVVKFKLRHISTVLFASSQALFPSLMPNTALCTKCFHEYLSKLEANGDVDQVMEDEDIEDDNIKADPSFKLKTAVKEPKDLAVHNFNSIISHLPDPAISPLQLQKRKVSAQSSAVLKKVNRVEDVLLKPFVESGLPISLPFTPKHSQRDSDDLAEILNNIREKCKVSSFKEKKLLLGVLPSHWGHKKVSEMVGVSQHIAKEAKKLAECGFACIPQPKRGHSLSSALQQSVRDFFLRPENSRVMPGMKDKICFKDENGIKVTLQKHLLLGTFREIYNDFKTLNPDTKISFSSFSQLKPKEVLPLSQSRHHNVCVCVKHENVNLKCEAIKLYNYGTLLEACVCDMTAKECMYRRCEVCLKFGEKVEQSITELVESRNFKDDIISFKKWEKTDSTVINEYMVNSDVFIPELAKDIEKLLKHHFRTKAQGKEKPKIT